MENLAKRKERLLEEVEMMFGEYDAGNDCFLRGENDKTDKLDVMKTLGYTRGNYSKTFADFLKEASKDQIDSYIERLANIKHRDEKVQEWKTRFSKVFGEEVNANSVKEHLNYDAGIIGKMLKSNSSADTYVRSIKDIEQRERAIKNRQVLVEYKQKYENALSNRKRLQRRIYASLLLLALLGAMLIFIVTDRNRLRTDINNSQIFLSNGKRVDEMSDFSAINNTAFIKVFRELGAALLTTTSATAAENKIIYDEGIGKKVNANQVSGALMSKDSPYTAQSYFFEFGISTPIPSMRDTFRSDLNLKASFEKKVQQRFSGLDSILRQKNLNIVKTIIDPHKRIANLLNIDENSNWKPTLVYAIFENSSEGDSIMFRYPASRMDFLKYYYPERDYIPFIENEQTHLKLDKFSPIQSNDANISSKESIGITDYYADFKGDFLPVRTLFYKYFDQNNGDKYYLLVDFFYVIDCRSAPS